MENLPPAGSRSRRQIYRIAMFVSLIGLGDSVYLAVQHVAGRSVRCFAAAGCSSVLSSHYSAVAGIPIAAVGALAYFAAFSFATLAAFGYESARTALGLVVAPMLIATLGLLYVQGFVLHAFCDFCVLSATTTFVLGALVCLGRLKRKPV